MSAELSEQANTRNERWSVRLIWIAITALAAVLTHLLDAQTDAHKALQQELTTSDLSRQEAIRVSEAHVYATYLGQLGAANELLWTYVWTGLPNGHDVDAMWKKVQTAQGRLTADYSNALLVTDPKSTERTLLQGLNEAQRHQFHVFRCALKAPVGSLHCENKHTAGDSKELRVRLDKATKPLDKQKKRFTEAASIDLRL